LPVQVPTWPKSHGGSGFCECYFDWLFARQNELLPQTSRWAPSVDRLQSQLAGSLDVGRDSVHRSQDRRTPSFPIGFAYHILRHSFISALASEGVDQRVIDEVVGHQSEEQRKRYRHLYPGVMLGSN